MKNQYFVQRSTNPLPKNCGKKCSTYYDCIRLEFQLLSHTKWINKQALFFVYNANKNTKTNVEMHVSIAKRMYEVALELKSTFPLFSTCGIPIEWKFTATNVLNVGNRIYFFNFK